MNLRGKKISLDARDDVARKNDEATLARRAKYARRQQEEGDHNGITINDLPNELIFKLFSQLDLLFIFETCSLVSKKWRAVANSEVFAEKFLRREFGDDKADTVLQLPKFASKFHAELLGNSIFRKRGLDLTSLSPTKLDLPVSAATLYRSKQDVKFVTKMVAVYNQHKGDDDWSSFPYRYLTARGGETCVLINLSKLLPIKEVFSVLKCPIVFGLCEMELLKIFRYDDELPDGFADDVIARRNMTFFSDYQDMPWSVFFFDQKLDHLDRPYIPRQTNFRSLIIDDYPSEICFVAFKLRDEGDIPIRVILPSQKATLDRNVNYWDYCLYLSIDSVRNTMYM